MPIRRAGVSGSKGGGSHGWLAVVVVLTAAVGAAVALGDARAPDRGGGHSNDTRLEALSRIYQPKIEPVDLGDLDFARPASLDYVIETKQVHAGLLFVTGTMVNTDTKHVRQVGMELVVRDVQGGRLAAHDATVACREMSVGERCPWSLEVNLGTGAAEFEFSTRGLRGSSSSIEQLRASSHQALDASTKASLELRYVPEAGAVFVALAKEETLASVWVTVSALDEEGRVLGVADAEADAGAVLYGGEGRVAISGVRRDEAVASYDLRLGGVLLNATPLPASPDVLLQPMPIELPPIELPPHNARGRAVTEDPPG